MKRNIGYIPTATTNTAATDAATADYDDENEVEALPLSLARPSSR